MLRFKGSRTLHRYLQILHEKNDHLQLIKMFSKEFKCIIIEALTNSQFSIVVKSEF